MEREVRIRIRVSEDFKLEKAVCNHGFFMMAPNNWDPSTKTLTRPLRLTNHDSFTTSIHQPSNLNFLNVTLLLDSSHPKLVLSLHDQRFIRSQIERMLRISREDERVVQEFHKLNPTAKQIGFARIFRSPTLFEDIVKTILLCYSSWPRSLDMAEGLCSLEHKVLCCGRGRKRKRCDCKGNFPSPKEIAFLDVATLNRHCNLGLRASTILELAQDIQNGTIKLEDFAHPIDPPKSYARLMNIKGFGSFVVANIMMCLGVYQYIPIDTETVKHLEQVHGKTNLKGKKAQAEVIAQIYDPYAPYQCIAYWMERVEFYEKQLGKLSEMPNSKYRNVTSTIIQHVQNQNVTLN